MHFLKRRAENWVSSTVLAGCILITATLLYAAFQANALGERFTDITGFAEATY
jgi:hypothetical protein